MKRTVLALAVLLLSAGLAAQGGIKKEFEPFQGSWTLVSASGQEIPAGMAGLVFTGEKYEGLTNGKVDERGTIKLDPATKPMMSIDLVIAEGSSAGKTQLGLVAIAGDTMTLILAEPGDTKRPGPSSPDKLILKKAR
jgi:uncharacterized protein (TIGR03067 family)